MLCTAMEERDRSGRADVQHSADLLWTEGMPE